MNNKIFRSLTFKLWLQLSTVSFIIFILCLVLIPCFITDVSHDNFNTQKSPLDRNNLSHVERFADRADQTFNKTIWIRVVLIAAFFLILNWLISLWIARFLSRPLIQMEQHVKKIAERNWYNPLIVNRNDELGRLAKSIELMRKQLVKQEEAQQSMMQNISHELKTPIMVIRSFAQAIQDGVYPKGDMAGSLQVIDEEGARLEKLVKQLLYLTRLDYLSTQELTYQAISANDWLSAIAAKFNIQRPELNWELHLQTLVLHIDAEQCQIMIENILDNQIRYAESCIKIELKLTDSSMAEIVLWNDGESVDVKVLDRMFVPFHKGKKGKYGLGMVIAKRIAVMHGGELFVRNQDGGVSTIIRFPYPS